MRHIEAAFESAQRFELFTGSLSVANLRLYQRLGYRRVREKIVSSATTLVFMEKTWQTSGSRLQAATISSS